MDGVHDMGGMDGFGKVEVEQDEPPFHAAWEGRVLGMQRAMAYAGAWHIDDLRYAQEKLPPLQYLKASYYQRWQYGLEANVLDRGYVTADELKAGRAQAPAKPLPRKLSTDMVPTLCRISFFRQQQGPQRFQPGDKVRTRNLHSPTHTRLPRYARNKTGVVEMCHGCHMYPDSVAIDGGDNPQWLYTVAFNSRELWGPDADPTLTVSIDAFEPYLEPAT